MILGIDASNIRSGGGVTHLMELLRWANPTAYGFDRVVVWASSNTLARLEDRPWLAKRTEAVLEGHYLRRSLWQRFRLGGLAQDENCDLLFVPGGSFATGFRPVVSMSQNLLPFAMAELLRFGLSTIALRLMALRWVQSSSFKKAQGTIFLTSYARDAVLAITGPLAGRTAIIPHGIDGRFFIAPRPQRPVGEYCAEHPFRLLYVSIVDVYKHQWHLAEAVAKLRTEGFPVALDLIGPADPSALARLQKTLRQVDAAGKFIRYYGEIPHQALHPYYASADLCAFASSCENLPNILLEGMAAGLPTACSNRRPMPDVLGAAGVYFNPEDPADIANAIRQLLESPALRAGKAQAAYGLARQYSWQRCANDTFGFFAEVLNNQGATS